MNELLLLAFGTLLVIGTGATILEFDPYKKLISLSVLIAGVIPFIVDRGLLDVATAVALIAPLSTIFILMLLRRTPP
jgi:energy-converting hydrogenase A subunit D